MILGFKKYFSDRTPTNFVEKILSGKKITTIREDKHKRWKPGMAIHFATGVRTKNYECFLIGICQSVQEIEMNWTKGVSFTFVDGKRLNSFKLQELFINDGFNDWKEVVEFFGYNDFKGRIIHFTNLRY